MKTQLTTISHLSKHNSLGIILLLGFFHGLIYIFIIPPWQHYDEPGHFEYALMLANEDRPLIKGDFNQRFRRDIAASMMEYGFFHNLNIAPNFLSQETPIWIGVSQVGTPSLYYKITAFFLKYLPTNDIRLQLLSGRFVSLIFYLITITIAYGTTRELVPKNHSLTWMVPLTIAFLPGFTNLMTAFSNDPGAVTIFSLFIWVNTRMLRRGFSLIRLLLSCTSAFLCIQTHSTVFIALPLLILSITLIVVRKSWIIFGGISVSVVLIFLVLTTSWGDAAFWYRISPQSISSRVSLPNTPIGEHAIRISLQPDEEPPKFAQMILSSELDKLRGEQFTFGAWIWSSAPIAVRTPMINDGEKSIFKKIEVNETPTFYSFHGEIDNKTERVQVIISPLFDETTVKLQVYFGGFVLTKGVYPLDENPEFDSTEELNGYWGGKYFTNLMRNPSSEDAWPWIDKTIDQFFIEFSPVTPSLTIASILDPSYSGIYYKRTYNNLLKTFWGLFGWGNIPLIWNDLYKILFLVTYLGIIGVLLTILRSRIVNRWRTIFFLLAVLSVVWIAALVRGVNSLTDPSGHTFIPGSHYAFPAIIPTVLFINLGWLAIGKRVISWFRLPSKYLKYIFLTFYIVLAFVSFFSIYTYFR